MHALCMCNAFVVSTELCKVSIKRYIKGRCSTPKATEWWLEYAPSEEEAQGV